MLGTHAPHTKSCEVCARPFTPARMGQRVCGMTCARKVPKVLKAKERAETKARKEKLKTRRDWLDECQAIVNKMARLRDHDKPCVSCERPATWDGQWHGSHFRSVGAASAVRLNLWNVHKACSPCNVHLSGNLLNYRPRLIERIGAERVEWLEAQNQIVRYEVDYLKRFKQVMGKRMRRMERLAAAN
jgi:hypothetical protein